MARVLITLDDLEVAVPLNAALEATGLDTTLFAAVDDPRTTLRRGLPDVIVLTGGLHEPPARALVAQVRDLEVLTLGLAEPAVPPTPSYPDRSDRLHQLGLTEIRTKPVPIDELAASVRRLAARRTLQQQTGISGQSPAIHELLVRIEQMAPVSSTVLVQGESGTGKELVARAVHDLSPRRGKPFITVNCAALPESLLESELFGHEKGAFTGATERRLGRFELADRGTIFLDEIGEIPESVQVTLLRVLENRTFFRVGGAQPIRVDVRVVAATNRSLRDAVQMGRFREDLYYRLSVLNLYLPPLRERRDDIPLLVRRFIREFSRQHDRTFHGITTEAMQRLVAAPWPGNVRQLRNLIESMVVLAPGTEIRASDIPPDILEGGPNTLPAVIGTRRDLGEGAGTPDGRATLEPHQLEFILRSIVDLRRQVEGLQRRVDDRTLDVTPPVHIMEIPELVVPLGAIEEDEAKVVYRKGMTMAEVERIAIEAALLEHDGNRRQAAQALGIGERTLYRKLKEYGIS